MLVIGLKFWGIYGSNVTIIVEGGVGVREAGRRGSGRC